MSNLVHFTRQTLLAASDLVEKRLSSAKFDLMVQRLELDDRVPSGSELSVSKKRVIFNQQLIACIDRVYFSREGQMTTGEAFIRESIVLMTEQLIDEEDKQLHRCLGRDGFTVSWDAGNCGKGSPPWLRKTLPENVNLPAGDDQVHQLLRKFSYNTTCGHLDQAIDAHTRGDWAAANAQIRTFLESLFFDLAKSISPDELPPTPSLNNCLQTLAKRGFLSESRAEWTQEGKGMLNGLLKMLNSDGSHKGLSNDDHSTFRLHAALVTARMILNRYDVGQL